MDVELQVIKHLARDDTATVPFIDRYCAGYKDGSPLPGVISKTY
ncbi:MAG: hypothetical protein QNJ54_22460 [Prochloraceae cyanobacterium]|nr:hypothetical protein [Prochloraceae cyanobacterium]